MEVVKESDNRVAETNEEVENVDDENSAQVHSGGDKVNETKRDGALDKSCELAVADAEKGRKRKKPRRGKAKKKQWVLRKDLIEKEEESCLASPTLQKRRRSNTFIHGQPAPNNTTQFIMEDHTDLQDLDAQLTAQGNASNGPGSKTSRSRDPSFSVDSDEEFYSSPEDEEEFLTKEFSNTYEDVHVERLGTMSKAELIQEYLQLEERVDTLEKKLKTAQSASARTAEQCGNSGAGTDSDGEVGPGELPMEPAMAEKIRIFQEEINKLTEENHQLCQENDRLKSGSIPRPTSSLSSSVDSESDSSTSSGSSSSSSSGQSNGSKRSNCSKSSSSSRTSRRSNTCTPTGHIVNGSPEAAKAPAGEEKVNLSSSDECGSGTEQDVGMQPPEICDSDYREEKSPQENTISMSPSVAAH